MKKTVLVSLFVFISFLANAQNWKSHPKKPYSGTDSCLVWQDSTKKFYRIKCSEINTGGSSAIDTTKVGRIEQGRGTAPIFMYFNGVAWVRNDTSYVPQSGTNKFSGNLLSNQSFLQVGLGSSNNTLTFADEVFTGIKSASATSETQISAYSTTNGYADISVYNPLGGLYDRRMVITGTGNNTPDQSFRVQNGLLYYFGNYTPQMTDDRTVPDIGKVKQLISDSIGTVQSTTLADGKIWIGDGTNTAFPRTLSGDVTINNLGEATVDSINGITKSYYDPTSSIQTQLNNKQNTLTDANFATFINSTTNKTTPVDADIVPIVDVTTGKRFSLSNLWTNFLINKIQTTALTISTAWERKGVANNSSAASGYVGEVLRASGSGVSIVSATTTSIGTLSLPEGNYECEGTISFVAAGGALLGTQAVSVSETSAFIGLGEGASIRRIEGATNSLGETMPTGSLEVKKSATSNVYINGFVGYSGGTVSCIWTIKAKRIR